MTAEAAPLPDADAMRLEHWNHRLLSGLVVAHFHLADGDPDAALHHYFKIIRKVPVGHHRSHIADCLIGPTVAVRQILHHERTLPCDPGLFDRFLAVQNRNIPQERRKRRLADMLPFHPLRPDPIPLLTLRTQVSRRRKYNLLCPPPNYSEQ